MEREFLDDFYKGKTRIKLILKDNSIFTGRIKRLGENTLMFLDKYNKEIPISLDSISRAVPVGVENE